jgi:glycosyltransferase involved in cell wall biosynthesis
LARKLVALLDDAELRSRMGAAGLERVKNELAWEHEVPRLLAAYDELFK